MDTNSEYQPGEDRVRLWETDWQSESNDSDIGGLNEAGRLKELAVLEEVVSAWDGSGGHKIKISLVSQQLIYITS